MSKDWRRGGGVLVNVNLANHKGQFAYFSKSGPSTIPLDRPFSPQDPQFPRSGLDVTVSKSNSEYSLIRIRPLRGAKGTFWIGLIHERSRNPRSKKKSGPNGFFVFGSTNTIPGFQKFEIFSSRYFEKIQEFTKDR